MEGKESSPNKRKSNYSKESIKPLEKIIDSKPIGNIETCEVSANLSIYFKIIHNEKEFYDFQNNDFTNTFHPTYTYELFTNEKINGYKGLKILISLTPKYLSSHINIIYSKKLEVSDDLENIFKNHFKDAYCIDTAIFLKKLKEEGNSAKPQGKIIYKDIEKKISILSIDILNDNFLDQNLNYQILTTFFIDAASFIPLETNFWFYFLIISEDNELKGFNEKNIKESNDKEEGKDIKNDKKIAKKGITCHLENEFDEEAEEGELICTSKKETNINNENKITQESSWFTVGFCSYKNFHLELYKYNTMLSQFLIISPYQRKGYGSLLLEKIYNYLAKDDKECREITTEDPDIGFILMRDLVIINIIMDNNYLTEKLKKLDKIEITSKDKFNMFLEDKDKLIKNICSDFKLQENLVERAYEFILFSLVMNNKEMYLEYENLIKHKFIEQSIKNSDVNQSYKNRKKGPFIYFHDDESFDCEQIFNENKQFSENNNDTSALEQKITPLLVDYFRDLNKIVPKIKKKVLDIQKKLGFKV